MYAIVFKTVITFLVVYALIDMIIRIIDMFFGSKDEADERVFVVVKVLNQEKNLEYIVRSIIWKNLTSAKGGKLPAVLIVDMGSDDETSQIAMRLANDYPFIYYTDNDDFEKFKKSFDVD